MSCDVGLYGLAVMGQNFALNMAEHGFKVSVCNRSPAKVDTTVARAQSEGELPLEGHKDPKDFVLSLSTPRKIVLLVMAGKPVDATIALLSSHMEAGDVIIDGGNEWYPNSVRRAAELAPQGIHFIGMGISGGEEGARKGPSLMPGGPKEAYDMIAPILLKCAAQVDGEACTGYCGPIGAGNYVKMVHNGIEYGDMQLIGECYDILKNVVGMSNQDMSKLFTEWNKTELDSYLIEITSIILAKKDDQGEENEVVDYVLDKTGMKGTGRWTVQEAAEQSVAAPTIAAALDARYMSGRKEERQAAEKILQGPPANLTVDKTQIIQDLQAALYCSKIASYAQGLSIIKAASDKEGWDVDLGLCAQMWRGGCIIRAQLLKGIHEAVGKNPGLPNLMVDSGFAAELNSRHMAWRRVVTLGVANGIALPSLSASLAYYDQYRRATLPANLIQAQRDFFGGHTYERTDKPGVFHTLWDDSHKALDDMEGRTAGNV
jgi:6-phosphogluconate dehydrogenase